MRVYIAVLVLLILVGGFLAKMLPVGHEESSVLSEEAALLAPLMPTTEDVPREVSAEFAAPFAQNVFDVRPRTITPPLLEAPRPATQPVEQKQPAPAPVLAIPQPAVSAVPVSFVYFFNGTKVVPGTPVKTVPMVYTSAPFAAPSTVVSVFVPQVVPSRVGMPKLVYPNGVVIKPQVYYPHQPVRNSFRVVMP